MLEKFSGENTKNHSSFAKDHFFMSFDSSHDLSVTLKSISLI